MAKSDTIDAVDIASPNSLHASQAITFLSNGKYVLCEKPMASNTKEVENHPIYNSIQTFQKQESTWRIYGTCGHIIPFKDIGAYYLTTAIFNIILE